MLKKSIYVFIISINIISCLNPEAKKAYDHLQKANEILDEGIKRTDSFDKAMKGTRQQMDSIISTVNKSIEEALDTKHNDSTR